jgi:serine/threonine protein kinase
MTPPTKSVLKSSETSSDPLVGQTLGGKYAVVRLIGRGGVGLVYHARQTDVGRDVVVKVLGPHWATDAEALARFDREAKRLSGLHHPNIVEMYDFGREGDRAYLVMEYLAGELLSEHVARKKRLTLEEFVPIAAQLLKGIGHAHSREVMVRDVKPANVMLCERKGRANFVKLLDFGLAKMLRGEQAITEEHVMGTVGYLAPEAIRGEPIDLRVDVYALGVLFYYMLAGRLPFEGESNAAVFYKTIHEEPKDLRELLGLSHGLPDGLVDLVHQCLAKKPEDRPADADRIVERLIDVVPAALFRLPRANTERHGVPMALAPGAGNTGMLELVGDPSIDASNPTPIPGSLRAVPGTVSGAQAELASARAAETGRTQIDSTPVVPTRPSRPVGLVAMSVVAGAALAVLLVGGVMMLAGDDDDAPTPDAAVTKAAGVVAKPDLDARLDAIDARIARGDLDAASTELDALRKDADDPDAKARVAETDGRLVVARLLGTAARLEGDGDSEGARATYREVLRHDAGHALAKAALARLEAPVVTTPATPPVEPSALADVQIASTPLANLEVDGVELGVTPYQGKLAPGRHTIRISARGYAPYEGTFEVAATGTTPLTVALKGKGAGHRDPTGTSTSAATPKPDPKPDPASEPKPDPKPDPASEPKPDPKPDPKPNPKPDPKPAGNDPFLPTKKPSGDIFLPGK